MTLQAYRKLTISKGIAPAAKPEELAMIKLLVQRYAPECTFKTNGDFSIHAELTTKHLPAWISAATVQHEMPYPLMVKAYPDTVNKIVRPLLERSIIDRVAQINWDRSPFLIPDYIVCIALIIEMLATKKSKCLSTRMCSSKTKKVGPCRTCGYQRQASSRAASGTTESCRSSRAALG